MQTYMWPLSHKNHGWNSTVCHKPNKHILPHHLCQLPGKIRKNIRFGSTITNRFTNGQIHIVILLSIFPGEWEGVLYSTYKFLFKLPKLWPCLVYINGVLRACSDAVCKWVWMACMCTSEFSCGRVSNDFEYATLGWLAQSCWSLCQ